MAKLSIVVQVLFLLAFVNAEHNKTPEAAAADSAAEGTAAEDAAGAERPVAAEEADVKKKEAKVVTEAEEADVSSPEELVYTARAQFYNFRNDEWKQEAFGDILMSRKKDTGVVTFEMQQQSDLQVVARFEISDEGDYCILTPNFDSDRCWQWQALYTSQDGVQVEEHFAVKFPDSATAAEFALAFEDAKASPQRALQQRESEGLSLLQVQTVRAARIVRDGHAPWVKVLATVVTLACGCTTMLAGMRQGQGGQPVGQHQEPEPALDDLAAAEPELLDDAAHLAAAEATALSMLRGLISL